MRSGRSCSSRRTGSRGHTPRCIIVVFSPDITPVSLFFASVFAFLWRAILLFLWRAILLFVWRACRLFHVSYLAIGALVSRPVTTLPFLSHRLRSPLQSNLLAAMASKLCCIAEEDEARADSPELPNARVPQPTPANRPLLLQAEGSPTSHFTSARSEDLHVLRELFDSAEAGSDKRALPAPIPRPRFGRPSMQSLRSLHKMSSMRSIIRRKFSKEASAHDLTVPGAVSHKADETITEESSTMIVQPREAPNEQFRVAKKELRKHLLSDKKSEQGGYDSDAEMLDDIANRIGKKTTSKRLSVHSIEWTPSIGSKPTPSSSTKGRISAESNCILPPYVQKPIPMSFSNRVSQVLSTPNFRSDAPREKDHRLRRSHSATSMGLPKPSPISPLRLPSLSTYDADGVPWSEAMHKSLRLSQFPAPPHLAHSRPGETKPDTTHGWDESGNFLVVEKGSATIVNCTDLKPSADSSAHAVEIRVQQPTLTESPRPSRSVCASVRDNIMSGGVTEYGQGSKDGEEVESEENPRRSVHLYSMRISHHLRSGSLLSWDQLVDAPELPTTHSPLQQRTVPVQSRHTLSHRQIPRHDRQTSSSGFASNKVPSKWGKVIPINRDDRPDAASSLYLSRPQSPPGSLGGSLINLPQSACHHRTFSASAFDNKTCRRSQSCPSTDEAMHTDRASRRPVLQHSVDDTTCARAPSAENSKFATIMPLARKNSVADTKTSKFREDFNPSPPKKRLTPSSSIAKFLNPKRLSLRSQSEANLQPNCTIMSTDGPIDTLLVPLDREHRQSHPLISLQAKHEVLGRSKGANQVWDRAMQAHQEEKASMFLQRDRDLTLPHSLFRERSGSVNARHNSVMEDLDPSFSVPGGTEQSCRPLFPPGPGCGQNPGLPPVSMLRRRAIEGREDVESEHIVSAAFEGQGDATEVVGAWGRYPSHTRHDRTFSAGRMDRVETRDFALEAAIRFASARNETHDDDLIDPTECLPSPVLLPGEKRKKTKKKVGSGRMAKSNSMTFGKALMKNYTKMFRSQSTEFRRHGRGHRSSVASGGILEFPELELVPDVWTGTENPGEVSNHVRCGNLLAGDSMATLRPRRNSSAPNLNELSFRDGADDLEHAQDQARVWSVYYDDCIPSFPRASFEADPGSTNLGLAMRRSIDDRRVTRHSTPFTSQGLGHSRQPSQWSHRSTCSLQNVRPSFRSTDNHVGARDDNTSMASVRTSTIDLISKFKEEEALEHDRVLSLTRSDSLREFYSLSML